jgi:hypothetical protein
VYVGDRCHHTDQTAACHQHLGRRFHLPKEDTIYALPRDGEYSPASGGGVQVDAPDPLFDPVVILTGATSIDACSPVKLVARDSFNVGGLPFYNWTLVPGTEGAPNPNDLTNNPLRVFNATLLQGMRDALANATMMNREELQMPSGLLEAAASYRFILYVTSRWKRTSQKEVLLTKLSFAAPMVSILGSAIQDSKRPNRITLQALGTPSQCEDANSKLGYRWTMVPPPNDPTDIFTANPDISTIANALVLPEFTLSPPDNKGRDVPIEANLYNFTVACYVDEPGGDVPEKTAFATATVRVTPSPIYIKLLQESRVMTLGDILVLDARMSQDPDYPTADGNTFKGSFTWKCLTPDRQPCYPSHYSQIADGTIYEEQIVTCRQDVGNRLQAGGVSFYAPLFDEKPYCQYARGVMMFQTNNYTVGDYKFALTIADESQTRTAKQEVNIEIVLERVPMILLTIKDPKERYPITREIRIVGMEEGTSTSNMAKTYSWIVLRQQLRWDPALAAEASNDPNAPYLADQYQFEVDDSLTVTDAARFQSDPNIPNLLIRASVLQPDNTYRLRLVITLESGTQGYSDITITTAGLPPRSGTLIVSPEDGSMDTPRVLEAKDWTADNIPLTYQWGYMKVLPPPGGTTKTPLTTDPLMVSVLEVPFLPLGLADSNYTLTIWCDITTPYGVTTTEQLAIKSFPPQNSTEAVTALLDDAAKSDPATVMGVLSAALSIDPTNEEVQNRVVDMLANTGDIPVTQSQLTQNAALIADLISNGKTDDSALNIVESLVINAADGCNGGCISVIPGEPGGDLAGLIFGGLGGLLPGAANPAGGRRLMQKYRNVDIQKARKLDAKVMPRGGYLAFQDDDPWHIPDEGLGRLPKNHPDPHAKGWMVAECPTAFCDKAGLVCIRRDVNKAYDHQICCKDENPETLCNDPPCWFRGPSCPRSQQVLSAKEAEARKDPTINPPHGWRRLNVPETKKQETAESESDSWFDQWNAYNFPLGKVDDDSMSDWDRASAYHGWHPDVSKRKLMYASVDPSKSQQEMLEKMEQDEAIELAAVQAMVYTQDRNTTENVLADATQELAFDQMDPNIANLMKMNAEQARIAQINWKLEYDRNNSQRITRIAVMRDQIAKAVIRQITSSETKIYPSVSFTLQLGKTPNLQTIHPSFEFPQAFVRPSDSPDYPTPTNPLTGFAFEFVQYVQNVYSWSDSNPRSTQDMTITLIVMKASTDDLNIKELTDEPVRVFKDLMLFSNALCLYWDRFAANTAGGAWSTQGVSNDGTACITTNLSDVGVFMDGRVPEGNTLIDAATDWERESWESTCIGCGDIQNMFVIAVLGMVIFTDILLILMGYVLDETRRGDMQKQKLNSRYYYDGDGLTGPMNVDDCIAYSIADRMVLLWLGTMWKVLKREHALLSPVFYHETFTRPQRLLCFGAMSLGILAMNAVVQSRRGYLLSTNSHQEYVMSGVLSGLLTFPVYCGLVLMFSMRPMPVKKRLIKRTYNPREIDLIAQKRRELDHTSNLMPPPGYLQLPPPPPGGIPHPPGNVSLLTMPPALPLPPLPPSAPGGSGFMPALPPPPPTGAGSLPGIPTLPALPGSMGGAPGGALPPPPRYPPPPKGAKAPPVQMLLPPMEFQRGPPPRPQIGGYDNTHSVPGTMIPNSPYVVQGNMMALDNGSMGETGGTSQRPLPIAMDAQLDSTGHHPALPSTAGAPEVRTPPTISEAGHPLAVEADPIAAPVLEKDGQHSMYPPSEPSEPPSELPGTPGNGMTLITPRGGTLEVPADHRVNTVFVRGQPNQGLAAPFPSGPPGPGGFSMTGPPPGAKPPPGVPPAPGMPGMPPGMPGMPPAPPPPPKEDDQAFVRRIRLTYMDKVIKEHEKHELLEDHDELGKDTPGWVFKTMTLMPYLGASTFSCFSIFVILAYGTKFLDAQAERWVYGSVVGLLLVLFNLELFRALMMTLVELRKFENRKKSKAGHFLPRRVRREDDKNFQEAPKPRLWKNSVAAPAVPKGHQNPQLSGPSLKPRMDMPGVPSGNLPPLLNTGPRMSGLPVAPPPPPPKSRPGTNDFANAFSLGNASAGGIERLERGYDGGVQTPTSQFSGTGQFGMTPPVGPPGAPDLPGFPAPGPPTPQSQSRPGSGSGTLGALRQQQQQSLSEQVKAGTDRANKPPPPRQAPGSGPASRTGSRTGSPRIAPPAPPAAPPPVYSRPKSRPTSAGSKASPPKTPPKTPPAVAEP